MLEQLATVILFLCAQIVSGECSNSPRDYPAETHHVISKDGYILQLQRIPYGKKLKGIDRKVVFLMHGLTVGSNSFTFAGPKYGMAYNFADAGYDVWMGNSRGNKYSRRHVSLNPDIDKFKFFDFSYEEIALFDLPAMIDYVLTATKQNKLHYIGNALGGTVFFVLNSMTTRYHSKIASAHLLGGIGYQNHLPNTSMKILSLGIDVIYKVLQLSGNVEMKPSNITSAVVEILVDSKVPPELIVGASVKQFVHLCQNMRDKCFSRWNFGNIGNLSKYGKISPPTYDLSKIYIDVTIHYSLGDVLQSEVDALAMVKVLPCARAHKVGRDSFKHVDFLASQDAKELVTDYIIKSFRDL